MNINFNESFYLKKIPNKSGAFGFLATHKSLEDGIVIKIVPSLSESKKELLNYLLSKEYIENSGYPLDSFEIDEVVKGYLIKYFDNAYTFDFSVYRDNFNYYQRIKAAIDCALQLKQFHSYGLLFNDISLRNQLIDKLGGHLIDFDSASYDNMETNKKIETSFNLSLNGRQLLPSKNLDKLKQALVNLSLIYQIDLEEVILNRSTDVKDLFSLFNENKEIFKLLYSYLSSDNSKPYFDVLSECLQDKEKIAYEKAMIYKKVMNSI